MHWIDLRSDTVTLPTPKMRKAMAEADLGDDVYGEDPTINRLQELAAERLGKEAGLFLPSGTMGNLVAVLTHCGRGDEVIMGDHGHTFLYEGGGISALGGVHPHIIPNQPDGTLLIEDISHAVRSNDIHFPHSQLLILENTHNKCGGAAISRQKMLEMSDAARKVGLAIHLDGARIFNAAVDQGLQAKELTDMVDSVTFCLSKGLCAPVGSVLCGSKPFIDKARRIRKQLGGGMRQAGVLAAAGIIALEEMVNRLKEDHERASQLAKGLSLIEGIQLDKGSPKTNMVYIKFDPSLNLDADTCAVRLGEQGIKVGITGLRHFRLVCHYWISDDDIPKIINAFREALKKVKMIPQES